ncbi:MAG: exonuclease domain-containing protein [Blautia sp.]|nr:exonuclease domain-containing protein [Blautia sp.]MDD7371304.1 exonuclease domain-containing protein [Bacillota bacterium]MDY3714611.1 3'-5' exonuclease [Blautia sp.]
MNYIVFDLEWNQCPYGKERENKKIPFEIIEIGAVKLNEERKEIERFQQVIRPTVYHRLHFRTKEILNIDQETLEEGIPFSKAVRKFLCWCGEDVMFCTWGQADLVELQRNMKYYKLSHLLKGPVFYYDVQKIFGIEYEGNKSSRSLEYAIDYLQMKKEECFHRALHDAWYTAQIFASLPMEVITKNYSIDCYQNPKSKKEEIKVVFERYSKYISREFSSKEEATKDREVVSTRCFLCGKTARKKIRWFSLNSKIHICLAVCPEHGYLRGKIRLKKTDEGNYYVIKTIKKINDQEAELVKERRDLLRKKRREKRHQS